MIERSGCINCELENSEKCHAKMEGYPVEECPFFIH